jgi:hypothetical protein
MRVALALFMILLALPAASAPPRERHNSAVISWKVPAGYEDSYAVGDPFLITYEVQASAPGPIDWQPLTITEKNWYRAEGLTPGLWRFRVQALLDGQPLGVPSGIITKAIPAAPATPQPRTPPVRTLEVAVN